MLDEATSLLTLYDEMPLLLEDAGMPLLMLMLDEIDELAGGLTMELDGGTTIFAPHTPGLVLGASSEDFM